MFSAETRINTIDLNKGIRYLFQINLNTDKDNEYSNYIK